MSKDNLILFPKKSKHNNRMSDNETKWMISASLLVILTLAIGVNSTLFSRAPLASTEGAQIGGGRSIASINPIFKISWEKKAFEVLETSDGRDIAHVGKQPSAFDKLAFGSLEGKYAIRLHEGRISEIKFASKSNSKPKNLMDRKSFVEKNLALFSKEAKVAEKVHHESNDELVVERFQLKSPSGQDLSIVQVLSDKDNNLISMTVQ